MGERSTPRTPHRSGLRARRLMGEILHLAEMLNVKRRAYKDAAADLECTHDR